MYSFIIGLFVLFIYFFFGKKSEEPRKIHYFFGSFSSYSFYEDTGEVIDRTS